MSLLKSGARFALSQQFARREPLALRAARKPLTIHLKIICDGESSGHSVCRNSRAVLVALIGNRAS